ncbi:hypothetical protein B0H10DRAFT_1204757 [Mycena sp. CBHHK59/15]|nr:hypothetical protein B0H10DRAFT_1204757 [Mycena sp. CBHHK59/15]
MISAWWRWLSQNTCPKKSTISCLVLILARFVVSSPKKAISPLPRVKKAYFLSAGKHLVKKNCSDLIFRPDTDPGVQSKTCPRPSYSVHTGPRLATRIFENLSGSVRRL